MERGQVQSLLPGRVPAERNITVSLISRPERDIVRGVLWISERMGLSHRMEPAKKERKQELTPLREIISGLLTDGTLPFHPDDMDIWKVWDDVVGETISASARPTRIRKGRLSVTVSDPIWLQELTFLESAIREKLNSRLGRTAVDRIDFRVGRR